MNLKDCRTKLVVKGMAWIVYEKNNSTPRLVAKYPNFNKKTNVPVEVLDAYHTNIDTTKEFTTPRDFNTWGVLKWWSKNSPNVCYVYTNYEEELR